MQYLVVPALGGVAGLMASIGGEERHVQPTGLAQLQIILLVQQVSPAHQLVQAAHAKSSQTHAHLLSHKGKEVHLQGHDRSRVALLLYEGTLITRGHVLMSSPAEMCEVCDLYNGYSAGTAIRDFTNAAESAHQDN